MKLKRLQFGQHITYSDTELVIVGILLYSPLITYILARTDTGDKSGRVSKQKCHRHQAHLGIRLNRSLQTRPCIGLWVKISIGSRVSLKELTVVLKKLSERSPGYKIALQSSIMPRVP